MTVSIWRYSHLLLALSSAVFLILAAFTGIILAFEPIENGLRHYKPIDLSEVTVSETLVALDANYEEVLSIEIDADDFVRASVITQDGDGKTLYVHPKTGEKLGEPQKQSPVYQFATNLHRSLFLKSVGRFFVGLVSFLLCLISVTGLILIIKRQGGLLKLFLKIQKEYFELRYHVILGRLFFIPIILIAATGVYLSAEKFSLLPDTTLIHSPIASEIDGDMTIIPSKLEIFEKLPLSELRSINFPFSKMPEDYFEIALKDKELHVHQYTGAILSEVSYPFTALASRWSLTLHTGQGSILWSVILLLASISILFFIYSGFMMWRKRVKNTKSLEVETDKDQAEYIILVGSETGTTFSFANRLATAFKKARESVFVGELNQFSTYANAKQLIILTATCGEGEATTNARKFETLCRNTKQPKKLKYAVVGFGSLLYPDYCAFAIKVDTLLNQTEKLEALLPLYKINNQDERAFQNWVTNWSKETGVSLQLEIPAVRKSRKPNPFTVIERTALNEDDTFMVRMRPKKKVKFQSGDLAGIIPEDGIERLYSIAKIENDVVLSVRKHEYGVCSPLLSDLKPQSEIELHIKRNTEFHFPKNNKPVVLIANGTGIAPFLGMLHENKNRVQAHLFLGLRTKKSLQLYEQLLSELSAAKKLASLHVAYSRGKENNYVQDIIHEETKIISQTLAAGGSIFICGSLAMQNDTLEVLETISKTTLNKPLSDFEQQEQLKMDCY